MEKLLIRKRCASAEETRPRRRTFWACSAPRCCTRSRHWQRARELDEELYLWLRPQTNRDKDHRNPVGALLPRLGRNGRADRGGGDRHRADHADAGRAAGFPDRRGHHAVRDRDDGGGLHPASGRFQRVSHHAAVAHAVPPGIEYFLRAADSAERQHRHLRGGTRDRGVRKFRGRRQLHHRRGDLPGPDRDSVRRHQPWRGAHFGSHGALHSGCLAGQADVDRRGSELRADRRDRSARPAQATLRRGGILSAPWTARRASPSATPWPAS